MTTLQQHQSIRKLLITATSRSGSSVIAEVLNQHPRSFYLFEPLKTLEASDLTRLFDCTVWMESDHDVDNDNELIRKILWARRHRPKWYQDSFGTYEEEKKKTTSSDVVGDRNEKQRRIRQVGQQTCVDSTTRAIKIIRWNEANHSKAEETAIQVEKAGASVIAVFRHPGAVWASQLRLNWRWGRTDRQWIHDICEQTIEWTKSVIHRFGRRRDDKGRPEAMYVYFEDFVREPRRITREILDYADLQTDDDMIERIWRVVAYKNSHPTKQNMRTLRRERESLLNGWKTVLTIEQKTYLSEACKDTCKLLGYIDDC